MSEEEGCAAYVFAFTFKSRKQVGSFTSTLIIKEKRKNGRRLDFVYHLEPSRPINGSPIFMHITHNCTCIISLSSRALISALPPFPNGAPTSLSSNVLFTYYLLHDCNCDWCFINHCQQFVISYLYSTVDCSSSIGGCSTLIFSIDYSGCNFLEKALGRSN